MKRLLVIFIILGNSLLLLPALPHQEASLEQSEKSKKSHSETISLDEESENSVEDVLKKLGRTIHQTAWSQEDKDEPNSSLGKAVQTNSAKTINSWDLSHLLKLVLNLVHSDEEDKTEENDGRGKDNDKAVTKAHSSNEFQNSTAESSKSGGNIQTKYGKEDKTEENVRSGKGNSKSTNKVQNSKKFQNSTAETPKSGGRVQTQYGKEDETSENVENGKSINKERNSDEFQNSTAETSTSGGSAQTKYGEYQKNSGAELVSSSELNSSGNNQYDSPHDQKKRKNKMVTNSLQEVKAEKTTQSSFIDTYSSLNFNNREFSKIEQLIDKLDLQESERKQSIGENDYYDDYYDEDDSDDEYCDSYSSSFSSGKSSTTEIESNKITEDSYEIGGVEVFDDDYLKLFSETNEQIKSKMPTEDGSLTLVSLNGTGMQDKIINRETKEYYDFSVLSNEASSKEEKDVENKTNKQYPIQNVTTTVLQTEDKLENDNDELNIFSNSRSDEINLLQIGSASPEQNVTLTTKRYQIVLENTEYQKNNTEQSLTPSQTYIQSTTPFIADSITLPIENTETSNTENTLNYSFSSSSPFDVATLVTESPDVIQTQNPEKKKFTFKSESNNLETNQELLQSLPLSSSGEFISNISEKNKQSSSTSENGKQSLPTSEETQQLSFTSEMKKQFSDTSESDKQDLNISESDQKHTKSSENGTPVSTISEIDQQLTNTPESETHASNISDIDQQLTNNSESEAKVSNISESDQKLTNTSENDTQVLVISEIDQQLTNTPEKETQAPNIPESEAQVSNIYESDRQLTNTSESETRVSRISEKDQQITNISESEKLFSNISERDQQLSNTSESKARVSNISESDQHLTNVSESDIQVSNASESNQQFSNLSENDQLFPITSDNNKQLIYLETDSKNFELSESQKNFVKNEEEKTHSENSNSSSLTKEQEEIQNSLQNVIVFDVERNLNINGEAKELVPEETAQKINEFAFQQDDLQKDNEEFRTSKAIIINKEADKNLNINQIDHSLLVDEVSNPVSGMSPTYVEASKNIEENANDNDYYEFDVGISPVNSAYEHDEKSLESVKTSQMIEQSDQNNINIPSEPEKTYDTILEFLYKHSNSPFIKSLKEYQY